MQQFLDVQDDVSVKCPLCTSTENKPSHHPYMRCRVCGLEFRTDSCPAPILTNSETTSQRSGVIGSLTRAQAHAQSRQLPPGAVTLDFGAGRGDLVAFLKSKGFHSFGVERDKASVDFANRVHGVKLTSDIGDDLPKIDSISMWHSLEHLTIAEAHELLERLSERTTAASRIVISVPNSDSWLYRLFGDKYALFDKSAHPVNYSYRSISTILTQHSYSTPKLFFLFPYSFVGYLLSLTNFILRERNFLHNRFKRGTVKPNTMRDILAIAIAGFVALPALALSLVDILLPSLGLVLNCESTKDNHQRG